MTTIEQIANFAVRARYGDIETRDRHHLRLSVLDTLGCALGALGAEPVRRLRELAHELGGQPRCTLIGGGATAPDRAALHNGALVRYLDFMDSYAAPGEVIHPSDNFAPLLAAAELSGAGGQQLLTALAVAYQVEAGLVELLPIQRAGLNYTTPLALSAAAGAARLLGYDARTTAHAIALSAAGSVALAVIEAEPVSQWKGLASGESGSRALLQALSAGHGITGPLGALDGPHGLRQLVGFRRPLNWPISGRKMRPAATRRVCLKKHNAEFQAQSAIEAALYLRRQPGFRAEEISAVSVAVSQGAYDALGGGSSGPKSDCRNKEQADHNLFYLVAVALLDGEVYPAQLTPERIRRADVQALMRKVSVRPKLSYTWRTPAELPARVRLRLRSGKRLVAEAADYEGFFTRPLRWEQAEAKFHRLAAPFADSSLRREIVAAVQDLELIQVRDLTRLLARAGAAKPLLRPA